MSGSNASSVFSSQPSVSDTGRSSSAVEVFGTSLSEETEGDQVEAEPESTDEPVVSVGEETKTEAEPASATGTSVPVDTAPEETDQASAMVTEDDEDLTEVPLSPGGQEATAATQSDAPVAGAPADSSLFDAIGMPPPPFSKR